MVDDNIKTMSITPKEARELVNQRPQRQVENAAFDVEYNERERHRRCMRLMTYNFKDAMAASINRSNSQNAFVLEDEYAACEKEINELGFETRQHKFINRITVYVPKTYVKN